VPGWFLLAAVVVVLLAGHGVIFYPRIAASTTRLVVVVLLLVIATGLGTVFAVSFARLATFGVAISIALLSISLALAYDRRLAIFASVLASISLTISTGAPPANSIAMLATGASFAALLATIPSRGAFVRATVIAGGVTTVVFLAAGLAATPLGTDGAWMQVASGGLLAGAGSLAAGFVMLGVMPTIERLFDITTGLALAELRDTRQPLLRELQSRAPGTYNHSLAVASIAENAAEAIGADSRLVYVGGLYHDVGKLNKPEYFIENQGGGDNKHDKLSPAMSLLVIVGHVKDGLELAQEYNLPKVLRHFIESHHGTSLVEYFFHAARERAADEGEEVAEFSYRYPGPKPRTREAAILLICDGIESATRAMSDPTPSRIEALVRRMSRARLQDGQLDDSDLTFRELRTIEDAIIKSLCAIYHSRIAYPGGREEREKDRDREPRTATATASG
jgi:putative nucleotidyltransferase with HDIG domain